MQSTVDEAIKMTPAQNNILFIDDDPRHAKGFEEALIAHGNAASNFEWVRTLSGGLERLANKKCLGNLSQSLFAR
jgi:hypothetical protein